MPMFGAPRTARRAIASAVSPRRSAPSHVSSPGSRVWSRIDRRRPSQRTAWIGADATATSRPSRGTPDRRRSSTVRATRARTRLAAGLAAAPRPARPPAPAPAGDPIMPLAEVQRRHALHRLHGHPRAPTITTFDVDVIDVVAGDPARGRRSSSRVSGPAVDATGIAEGFCGSPIKCADGRRRRRDDRRDRPGHRRLRQQARARHADRGDARRAGRPAGRRRRDAPALLRRGARRSPRR